MKKIKQPGENISLKTKKNESPDVMDWINGQSNLMDSIRYLVENEIREHGVRNLQLLIPAERGTLVAGNGAGIGTAAVLAVVPAAAEEAGAGRRESAAAAEAEAPVAGELPAAEAEEPAAVGEAPQPEPSPAEEQPGAEQAAAAEDDIDDDDIDSWM